MLGRWFAGGDIRYYTLDGDSLGLGVARLGDDGQWAPLDGGLYGPDGFFLQPIVTGIVADGDGVIVSGNFVAAGSARMLVGGIARWSARDGWRPIANKLGHHSPSLGVVVGTTGGALAYDGETWRMLDHVTTSALAACESGVIAAGHEGDGAAIVLHTAVGTTPIVEVDGIVMALAATTDDLFVAASDPRGPTVRRWTTAPARAR